MNKGDVIKVEITDMLDDGRGYGRYEGLSVFVSGGASGCVGAVPGDVAEVEVTKAKSRLAEAKLCGIAEASADRAKALCPYFGECGGCSLQEMNYEAQLRLKENQVRSKLERLGGIENPCVRPIIGANTLEGYRNKATYAVGPHGEVGFVRGKSHYVVDVEDCMLQAETAVAAAAALREFLRGGNSSDKSGIRQMVVKTAFGTGEVMVVLESDKKEIKGIDKLAELLDDYIYNTNFTPDMVLAIEAGEMDEEDADIFYTLESIAVIHEGRCSIAAGKPTILETVKTEGGETELKFEISPQSFYQVNPEQIVRLYGKAMEYAELSGTDGSAEQKGKVVLDLYCGIGTIGIYAAAEMKKAAGKTGSDAGYVYGIESVKPAVIDANRNSVINGIVNTRYFCGKAEEVLPWLMGLGKMYKYNEVNELVEREPEIRLAAADVAVVDPPRAGCEPALLDAIACASPERIVYVSCDPGTLARDIKYLAEKGYEFIEATPVDMFPWTNHVESVVLLSRAAK